MSKIQKVRGFQDIYGENAKKYRYIVDTFRETFEKYNFKEIILPFVEDISLFKRSVGEATDIVQKEMYVFLDKGGREVALRPEGTASCVRAYIEEKMYAEGGYHKLFYEGAMFRYERPQAGRYRQFHQIGAEIFGVSSVLADTELISMVYKILKKLKIDFKLEINSLGDFQSRKTYTQELIKYLKQYENGLCETCKSRINTNPLRVLDCKVESCKQITKDAPKIIDYLSEESEKRFTQLKEYLKALNIDFVENPRLVRGLDYYTDTVFEFTTDQIGAQGTVAAGGRYDNLVEQLGGPPTPALGFAAGIERLILLVKDLPSEKPLITVIPLTPDYNIQALSFSESLRNSGIKTETLLKEGSLKSMMKTADKLKSDYVVFISDKYELKEMKSGNQEIFYTPEDTLEAVKDKI
ncbi:histidyl-tRNA synthetase [Sulfurihydrogenibium azorense Az-Fu1]|uniref:Histidine--tRNA ligase n=1 Tax=Sulfurihydrogenibium azorense (strain DSM 15241 / OCM 825 / Az-Fu1) TaxID=204536 RepID=C1DVR1_SULAA|nr:histidine--tRNA ligase [Sulfurihydrogenibium azorense]ACN98130.1 histidyl-tRNA synthetase [Sulfurihydrogenibium azorense Az-Fu1]